MSGWWLSGLLVVLTVVNSKVDLDLSLRVAHCRATCLYKFQMKTTSDYNCRASANCSQCWEACALLQESRIICDNTHCGPGCLEACRFNSLLFSLKHKIVSTPNEEVLSFTNVTVSWPPHISEAAPVYIVMGSEADRPWSQLCQTLDLNARLAAGVDQDSVKVLVVDWRGLSKVYGPRAESPLLHIIRSLGMNRTVPLHYTEYQRISDENETNLRIKPSNITLNYPWMLRMVSIIHHTSLVLVQISWDTPYHFTAENQLMYLVTWEVDGGLVRGNLLTNSTTVTLSLGPDTVYRIGVSIPFLDSPGVQTEPLLLDTRYTTEFSTSTDHLSGVTDELRQLFKLKPTPTNEQTQPTMDRHALVAGVAVAVTLFFGITLTFTWRWQHRLSLPHSKLIEEEGGTPNIYRVFPPAIRLISKPNIDNFSSTENLLQPTFSKKQLDVLLN